MGGGDGVKGVGEGRGKVRMLRAVALLYDLEVGGTN